MELKLPQAAKISVLIADDHALLRTGVRNLLGTQEDMHVVGEASDGNEAIAQVNALHPDVLLLDITMPNRCGVRTITELKEQSTPTRILAFTMHDSAEYARTVLSAGADGYLVKSALHSELLAAIRTVHQGHTYIDVSLGDDALNSVAGDARLPDSFRHRSLSVLSSRERQVLELVALGHTHKEVANQIAVSVKTVETYRARLADKLGIKSRADLVRFALQSGVLRPELAS